MYGLTLFAPQMLFFSISHAFPTILLVVLVSALFLVLLVLLNVACAIFSALRTAFTVPYSVLVTALVFQLAHLLALFTYAAWSSLSITRIAISLAGLGSLVFTAGRAASWAVGAQRDVSANQQAEIDR